MIGRSLCWDANDSGRCVGVSIRPFLSGPRLYGYSAGVASKDRFSFEFPKVGL